jgi:hypothetical protein
MIGGFTIFSIGIIGIYLSKIFAETKDRPYTIIREVYQRCGGTADDEDAGRLRHTAALPPDVRFR